MRLWYTMEEIGAGGADFARRKDGGGRDLDKIKLTGLEKRWILYDVGNSAFTLLISTIIPIYFNDLAGRAGISEVDYLAYWGYAASLATAIVAVIGPVLGTIADTQNYKKPIFTASMMLGVLGCAALSLPTTWIVFLAVFVLARVGYSASLIFYDSMLVDVTDNNRKLIGMISMRTLILAEDDDVLEEIMESNVISVNTLEDQESVAQMFTKYDFAALPVVDQENRLVGIITVDDAIDVLQEETTEDFEKMAGMAPSDKPYLRTGVFETWKSRVPWLLILMLSATLTSMVLTGYETSLAACSALIAFIPMLTGTGGNSGTQASVAVIRGLSLGEVEFSDTFRVVWKEIRVAVLCGVTLAACNFVKLMVVDRFLLHNEGVTVLVAAVICVTMVFTVLCAKAVGCLLPLLAERIHLDPAVMASPFISTVVDVVTLVLYFQVARAILHI